MNRNRHKPLKFQSDYDWTVKYKSRTRRPVDLFFGFTRISDYPWVVKRILSMRSLLCLSITLFAPVMAIRASNFNVNATTAAEFDCDEQCFNTFQKMNEIDRELIGARYDPDFYATASNFTGSKPGDLLKIELMNASHLQVPDGVTTYRFQYTSKDIDGLAAPVTGFIAFPYSPPRGGSFYRTIAYSHGTLGVFHGCAPSSLQDLYDHRGWKPLIKAGYAIIGTDYSGLGNNETEHKYAVFPEHANDIFYSVVAARHVFGAVLTEAWMSVGHSQGGGAVWKLAELEAELSRWSPGVGRYLGTVALAPGTRIYDMSLEALKILESGQSKSLDLIGELPWIALGIERLIPSFNFSLLGPILKTRLGLAKIAQACCNAMISLVLDLNLHQLLNLSSEHGIEVLYRFQNMTAPSIGGRNQQPILVIQGLNDTSVLPQTTELAWKSSCGFGNEVHLKLYPGMDHSSVVSASEPVWLSWINDRFDQKKTSGICSNVTVHPFDLTGMKARPN